MAALQGKHHAMLMKLSKEQQGLQQHMFLDDDTGLLVFANANQHNPVPVITSRRDGNPSGTSCTSGASSRPHSL